MANYPVEYKEYKAGNPQVEREQRNKIFDDIKRKFAEIGVEAGADYVTMQQLQQAINNISFPPSGLTSVATDSTLTGDGTPGDPLGVDIPGLVSADGGNDLTTGTDGGLYVTAGSVVLDGGYSANIGFAGGPNLQVGDSLTDRSLTNVTLNDWEIDCFPSGDITVEVAVNGSAISTGGNPSVTGGTNNHDSTSSWLDDEVVVGDALSFEVVSVSGGVQFVRVTLYGVKF